MTVIVVLDDRVTNRKILGRLAASLEEDAFVKTFADPEEALDWVKHNTPDLVITDFKMPGMDGAGFTRAFRNQPLCFDVPVMVVTAFEDRDFRYRALEAGATDFLLSPIDHHEFKVRARNLLTLSKQQQFIKKRASELEQRLQKHGRLHEEEMRRNRVQLLSVIDAVPAMISAVDSRGRCSFMNRFYAANLGINPDDAVGRTLAEIAETDPDTRAMELERQIFESGESPAPYEEAFVDRGGTTRTLLTTKRPVKDEAGRTINVVTVSLDITDRKRGEDSLVEAKNLAEAANRSKTDFLANMSHELRTPLNAIIGFAEMIQRGTLGPVGNSKYIEYADNICSSAAHLLGIINDILEVSKIEAGQIVLSEEVVDVSDTVADVMRLVNVRAREDEHDIQVEGIDALPKLYADGRKLKQILLNLVSNAIKFSGVGGTIRLTGALTQDNEIRLAVSDNGIGMSQEDIPRALERFGQVADVFARRHSGTGLGLPLTVSLIELHGGEFALESAPGEGTTATLTFPADRTVVEMGEHHEHQAS